MMTVTAINSLNPNTVTNNINFTAESKNSATKPAANTKAASAKKHKQTSKALETTIDLATFGAAGALGIMGYKGKWLQKGIKFPLGTPCAAFLPVRTDIRGVIVRVLPAIEDEPVFFRTLLPNIRFEATQIFSVFFVGVHLRLGKKPPRSHK